ncbi:hypothetical protein IEU95_11540 [Hoyosella rhizosphaerae]|uniref:Helix-turn-helix domain-containing protein n=1 Tax=Hoyosella rhizosphaerae TaxID=1755582 RepID=A0A916U911_9ACTN|nr:helix-turn-helix domain-containing protein [Hoyosella rhizosphaerae]MBN4927467.1 hypothetical protein [Hoyosella rhizosphaerae]GGC64200.1 hypothetical protein GCM10011410_15870 [Hoyosella rhizosphaerae]
MTEQATTGTRPRWSAAEAARRCGVGRATIQRALDGGRLPGAVKTEDGWQIPLEDLLAAGFKPDRPSPPEDQTTKSEANKPSESSDTTEVSKLTARVQELETELLVTKTRAESEAARRTAAEVLAQERLERVSDLRSALRMLEAAKPQTPTDTPPAQPQQQGQPTTVYISAARHRRRERRRSFREWWEDRKAPIDIPNGESTSQPTSTANTTVIEENEVIDNR